jgi:hypothetical protein
LYHIIILLQKRMKALIVIGALVGGFLVYYFARDKIFPSSDVDAANSLGAGLGAANAGLEKFNVPAPGPIEIRQPPIYPPRIVSPSGPGAPSQAGGEQAVVYGDPQAKDPYYESQENSDIPERMRNPENSYRPAPPADQHQVAVQAGIASGRVQTNSDNSQTFSQEFIQGGGEFMPGIFANDTFTDTNFSAF